MKKILVILMFLTLSGCSRHKTAEEDGGLRNLIVYCAEPFISEELWADFSYFEARNDCQVQIRKFTDAGEIIGLLRTEGDSLQADVICSIPGSLIEEALATRLFQKTEVENRKYVNDKFYFDKESYFIPYALSYLCLAYDSRHIKKPPLNLGELQDNHWAETIIMPDPVKTGTGRAFLHFSVARFGKNGFRYLWDGIQKNILLRTDSFDDGYRRFLAEEGSLIPAMITQMRYHNQNNGNNRIRGVILQEGTARIVENAAIMANSSQQILAKKFVEYLLDKDFQRRVWNKKWMYPVNKLIVTELGLNEDIAMYEGKSRNMMQTQVRREEELWLKKLNRTLDK